MIPALIFITLLRLQGPAQTPPAMPKATDLIGKMFRKYAGAKSLIGAVTMTQSSMGKSFQISTQIVYQRPDLIRVSQTNRPGKNPTELVSDGVRFSYTAIETQLSPPKLIESVHPEYKPPLQIGDMYFCIQPTMADRSLPLDVSVGRIDDLKLIQRELASFDLKGSTAVRGIPVYQIEGQWRDLLTGRITGTFDLFVTPDGDCVRFERHERMGVSPKWLMDHKFPPTAYADGIPVDTVWDSDFKVDAPVNKSVFSLDR